MTKIKPDGTETKPFVSHPPGSNVNLNIPKPDILFSDQSLLNEKFVMDQKTLKSVFKYPGEIFRAKLKKENLFILKRLGFQDRDNSRWYHPVLGEDLFENWLWFNIAVIDPESITAMLYKTGFVKGQKNVRKDIKKALDL